MGSKTKYVWIAAAFFCGAVMTNASLTNAGTISGQVVSAEANYEFSNCIEPQPPLLTPESDTEYNDAVYAFNDYIAETNTYLTCITEEANADMAAQADMIKNAHRAKSDAIRSQTEESRKQLNAYRIR